MIEGAIKLKEDSTYTIYTMNSATAGQYCFILPTNTNETINMLIDLHEKGTFDAVASGTSTKENLVTELEKIYGEVKAKYPNGMLILPMLDENEYKNTVTNLDKQKMFDETKKIGAITSELYKKMTDAGISKEKINQKIMIVEKEEEDGKYVNWLKEQMPNYVEGISLKNEPVHEEVQPSATPDLFAAPTPAPVASPEQPLSTPEQATNTDIFANTNQEPLNQPNEPTPTPEVPPVPTGNIFDNVQPQVAPATEEPKIELPPVENTEAPKENVDIFGISMDQPAVAPTPEPAPVVTPEPVKEEVQPEPAPQPVQDTPLEGTTTFSPLPTPAPEENAPQETMENGTPHKSNGFVNLAILLAILIVVTIASIELGKFLYKVYGA